jgi:RimJ/RimL family protein N-acetyltransferase
MAAPVPSPRLSYREFQAGDLSDLAALLADPLVMRYSWRGPHDLEGSRLVLEGFQRVYREGAWGKWALHLRVTGEFVGYCGLEPCPPGAPEGLELGYRLAPKFWGQGLASEAAETVTRHVFAAVRLPQIFAFLEPANLASVRVLEKARFRRISQGVSLYGKAMDIYRLDAPE